MKNRQKKGVFAAIRAAAEQLAAAIPKLYRWKISTCILPEICMPLLRRTICCAP